MYRRRAGTPASLFLALGLLSSLSPREALPAPGEDGAPGVSAPAPPSEAPRRISLPEGFHVTLFASEPDVQQPIAVTTDARGRLWVVECYSYPVWKPEGRDRVVIFEDTDHDGRFDRRKVFWERGANLTGIEIGFGGVWLCATPNLIHIPDADSNDVPDGDPVVHLDGWDVKGGHNLFNGLTWGPDGWLYGMNGILSNSRVGPPGTPDSERTPINCGVWRYHPTRRAFEVVAWGTTNPWGLDFDDLGEMFITNCVIPHAFHVIPGAHFERMYGQDFDPHLYGLLESCADHIHWAGGAWQDSRGGKGKHGEAGGGHAHAGAMIYLGDNWPDAYRGSLYTCNIHGNRINRDSLAPSGSGYVARHEKDFLLAGDEWFRGLEMVSGPDGAVFVIDWSDSGECHESDDHGAHHESGRIYKVSYGKTRAVTVDLAALEDRDLVRLQAERNEWHVRQARRILQERAAAGRDLGAAREELWRMFRSAPDAPRRLRALWALHVTGGVAREPLLQLLGHADEHVRAWAVRLACEEKKPSRAALEKIETMARTDASPRVRLSIASALQRIPLDERRAIARGLAGHARDSSDPNLPLMIWYGIEPLVPLDHEAAASLAEDAAIPTVRRHIARRMVDEPPPGPRDAPGKGPRGLTVLARSLAGKEDSAFRG
ncbi:MAG TPA: PVC-type heme-binding CxxCH protein, partial [Planctomycetota bacterium]|nr:PVC-type heme-binding CxxCH protein [Planctomycetota bacterium]